MSTTASTYYKAATRDLARENRQDALDEARRKKASNAILATVNLVGEVKKTKQETQELHDYASKEGWDFDKETSLYFKSGNKDNNPYVVSMNMSQMEGFKTSNLTGDNVDIDEIVFGKDSNNKWIINEGYDALNNMEAVQRLYNTGTNSDWSGWGDSYTPKTDKKGKLTGEGEWAFSAHDDIITNLGTAGFTVDKSDITTGEWADNVKVGDWFNIKTGELVDNFDPSQLTKDNKIDYVQHGEDGDNFLTMVGGEPALVNQEEYFALTSGVFNRAQIEKNLISSSKTALGAEYHNKSNPVVFDEKTGLRKFQTGQTGLGTAGTMLGSLYGMGAAAGGVAAGGLGALAIPGIGWAAAALMAIDWIAGANKAAKKYKKQKKMLGGDYGRGGRMGQHLGESADIAGSQAQRDLSNIRKDYSTKVKHMASEFGDASMDLQEKVGMAQKKTKGLYTGSVGAMKDSAMKRLRDSFTKGEETLEFGFESAYDKYTRDLGNQMASRQTELEDLYDQWKYAKDHDSTWENLF